MSYKYEQLRERIPLYLNKRLSEKERKEFEEALNQLPKLKQELMDFLEIKETYDEISKEIPFPAGPLYSRISKNVRQESRISLTYVWKRYMVRFAEYLADLFRSPRLSWGLVAVQLGIILLLVFGLSEGDRFRTLSSTEPPLRKGVRIQVVFHQDSMEKDIREILTQVDAIIIGGPSREGLYILKVKDDQEIERVLDVLRQSRIVRFAEKAQ